MAYYLLDLIGPYYLTDRSGKNYELSTMTMINPAIDWSKIIETKNKTADYIGMFLDYDWFSRYLRLV